MGKIGSTLYNIGVAVDQFGNTLAGGYADNTISARVGFYAHEKSEYRLKSIVKPYWLLMQLVINTTFYPVDGWGHCHKAYHKEVGNGFKDGSDIIRFLLSFIIIGASILIGVVLYTLWILQIVRPNPKSLQDIAIQGFNKMDRMIVSGMEITREKEVLSDPLLQKSRKTSANLDVLVKAIEERVK
ncbi:MAG: hypothetical protein QNK23_08085 [Crocinitomicaceae bacterium]|nr:hypothetical protein [Crocinitomicaceae bacterium]